MKKNIKKRKKKTLLILLMSVLFMLIVVGIIVFVKRDKDDNGSTVNSATNGNVVSTIEEQIKTENGIITETKYCNLYYPEKWEKNIDIKVKEDDVYSVQFFGKVENKEEQHLFDIVFGEVEGTLIGYYIQDEDKVPIYIKGILFSPDDSWTEEECTTIMMMQEDSNYTMGMLQKEENFVPIS